VRSGTRRLAPLAAFGAICVGALIFAVLLERVMIAQSAFELDRLQGRLVRAETAQGEALLEASQLESPARIERYALGTLGMVVPPQPRYIAADVRFPSGVRVATRTRPPPGLGLAGSSP